MEDKINTNGSIPDSIRPLTQDDDETPVVLPSNLGQFDLADLVAPMTGLTTVGEVAELNEVPITTPDKQVFFTAMADPACRVGSVAAPCHVIKHEVGMGKIYYVVHRAIVPKVDGYEMQKVVLYPCITTLGEPFFFPVRIEGEDVWAATARKAIAAAQLGWIRVVPGGKKVGYQIRYPDKPQNELPKPMWHKDVKFADLVRIALKDRLIDTMSHPVLLGLRGAF